MTTYKSISDFQNHLKAIFEENITLQKEKPQYDWMIDSADGYPQYELSDNWYFFTYSGRTLTNRPNLGLGFYVSKEESSRLKQLDCFSMFQHDEDVEDKQCYYIECGTNVSQAASVLSEVMQSVFLITEFPQFINKTLFNKARDTDSLKKYFNNHLPMMFCFDLPIEADIKKIENQYKRVAELLSKYGFGKAEYIVNDRCVKGYYQPTEEPKGFFNALKHGGQIGDTEGELIRLLDMCYQSFK